MKQTRKKQKQTTKQRTIDQLEFQIIPISINFTKQQNTQFYLYIEKGAQVLGKVDQLINAKRNTHIFSKTHNKTFHIANDKNLTYQWSIYKYTQDNQQQYLQSATFNIKTKYIEYLDDLEKRQADLYRIFIEKQKKTQLEQIWKDLRYDLTHNVIEISCKFNKMNANVMFKLIIKCDLDFRLQKYEQERQMRRLAKTVNATRKGSIDSKNKISQLSFYQSKEKINQVYTNDNNNINQSLTLPINLITQQTQKQTILSQNIELSPRVDSQFNGQNLHQSQIRVTDPEGIDVTGQVPQKFLNHRRTEIQDYYYRKKSSMLSDIIQESYQGSSNVITKSNQGEKLQSVDEIHQQEDATPLFSPLIKTQNYDPHKDDQYFDKIKRTTTLVQKASQQFQLQQNPKATPKRYSHYFPHVQPRNQLKLINNKQKQQTQLSVSDTKISSSRKSSFSQEQQKQIVIDKNQQRKNMIKNVTKVIFILVILTIVIYTFGLFDHQAQMKNTIKEKRRYNKVKIENVNKKEQSKKDKFK